MIDLGLLDDPKKYALLAAAAGLLSGRGNTAQVIGQGLQAGLLGLQTAQGLKDKRSEEEQQREMRRLTMDQMRQTQADQQTVRDVYSRNTMPGNLTPNDDEGNAMPAAPQGFNLDGLRSGLMGAGPAGMREFAAIQQAMAKDSPYGKVDIDKFTPESIRAFQQNGGRDYSLLRAQPNIQVSGGVAYDPRATQPGSFITGPESDVIPDGKRRWMPNPAKIALNRAKGTNVTVDNRLENKEHADKGALNVKNFGDIQTAAAIARKENALLSGLERIDLDTNKTTPANVTVSSWITALGGGQRFRDVAAKGESFTAFAKDLVLQRQLAQKGPQTESDARRLEQTVAQLGNTKEANALIVAFNKAQNNRILEQEKFFNDWWKSKKTYEGADDAWINGRGAVSIWDDPALKKFQRAGGGGTVHLRFDSQGNQIP